MRKAVSFLLAMLMLLSLCGCGHNHTWAEASCTEPKTCSGCGATEGEALGHEWKEASCTEPKTCTRCGATEGEALGHDIKEAVTEKEATCTETGVEKGICTRCGETVEETIPMKEHQASDWVEAEPATVEKDGKRVKKCIVCGKELESESFSLAPEEYEKAFKKLCKTISYKDLQRNPGDYMGSYIKLSGSVFQIISEASSNLYYSVYFIKAGSNIYLIYVDNYGSGKRILEKDRITVWGKVGDLYTYTTVRGDSNTVPTIYVEFYS